MAKRPSPSSAFALPGLSRPDPKKPYGLVSSSRGDYFSRNVSSKNPQATTVDNLDTSSTLVDDNGSFLPPKTEHTLANLTKTRPRNPGRRSPSPLARRKFEHGDTSVDRVGLFNSSLEGEITGKSPKDHKDDRNARVNALKERTTFSPGLLLTNDVGLSISSENLSVSRTSPKLGNKNRGNRPEVPPKPDRNRTNSQDVTGKYDLVTGMKSGKIVDKDVEEHDSHSVQPPPLPTSPPPLEDEMLPSLDDQTQNKEGKILLQESMFGKTRKAVKDSNFDYDLSTKLGKPIKGTNEVNELSLSKQFKDTGPSNTANGSSASRIAKWRGYGQTWSDNNQTSGIPKVGAQIPDKQASLDAAITSRLSKYETPYSSRQRKSFDRSPSSRRRRFKPVTLHDDSEKNSETVEMQGTVCTVSSVGTGTSYNVNPMNAGFVRLHGMQSDKRSNDSVVSDYNKGIDTKPQSPKERTMGSNVGRSQPAQSNSYTETFRQYGSPLDKLGISRTTNPEPTILLEYDMSSSTEKAIEIETNETEPFAVSETRTSNRTGINKLKSQSNMILKGEGSYSKSESHENRNDLMAKQQGSPGQTLPKVVIEYDGQVFSDSMAEGYDTETSDETKKSALFGKVTSKSTTHEKDYESDRNPDADNDDIVDYGEYSDEEEEDLDLGLDDVSLGDEDLTFEDLDSAIEEMERAKGIEDPELDQDDSDGVITQPHIEEIAELSEPEMEEVDEMLFLPPPMFASTNEGETEDVGDVHIMENGYEVHAPSPVIPSSLLEQQPRDDKRFHNLALEVWNEDDCVDWLDYIGLGHFTTEFREHHVDGKMLKNINFQLLEEIGIDSPDEREVILSEIYRRFHPEEEDMFEMEIQGALQSASEQERMKIMAVLNALRSPAFQAELGIVPSTGSSSPRDSETGFHTASETGSISSGMTAGSDDHHHDLGMPPPPPPPMWSQTGSMAESVPREYNIQETKSKGGKAKKQRKTSKDSDKSTEKEVKIEKHGQKQKKHKGMAKLLDSLSLSSGSSKLTKLFHHHASSSTSPSKKLNPAMQYLLQAGPQGLIRIWPTALSDEMNYCSFMVNMTTTSAEIIKLVFEKYEVVDDPRRFYVCEMSLGKGGAHHNLLDSDCPLLFQCRWQDPDKRRFELRCKSEGVIKMLFELDGYEDDLDYRSIPLSTKTPCSEALPLIVKKFNLPGEASEYYLVEVSEENEDDREEVADHVCPLRLQMAWSAPDHVFRLCRRPTEGAKDDDAKDGLDGWTTDATEDVSQEQGIHSEVSSAQEDDELDITPAMLGGVERDEIVEETSDDLMEGLSRLDSVIEEESEAIASQELENVKQELEEKEEELRELRTRSETLQEKELEIESLVEENKELRGRVEELNGLESEIENLRRLNEELRRKDRGVRDFGGEDDALVEKERELEELRSQSAELQELRLRNEELRKKVQDIEGKFDSETSLRDREIERLYARNNELSSKEKELETLKERNSAFDAARKKELEKLRLVNDEANSSQCEMTAKLDALQERNDELLIEVAQAEKLKQINRELCQKVDEGEIMRQELGKSEAEKKELKEKLEELERKMKGAEREDTEEVENLRKENAVLVAQCKEADEMKTNIIKLTAQLRDMEKRNSDEANNFQRKREELSEEKQQLQERIAELENAARNEEKTDTSGKEVEDLKLENIFLVERNKEISELKASVARLAAEARDNESFKQKYKELRDVESYLTKQVNTAETITRQKDKKLKESENKINTLTEAVKDMEAKLEEQEQNQQYLDQLLAMLKDRDPTLLHLINTSLASNEPEEWC